MDRKLQRTLMLKVLSHLDAGTTDMAESVYRQPAANYADADRAAQEQALLFRRGPLMMGLSCRVPNSGDYITDDIAGIPVVIVRGEDGVVRGFRNACSHRGTRVCEGAGHTRVLTCPYHGWTYALDGQLRGIPDKRSFPGVDPAEHGLQALPTVEHHGMVWMHPSHAPDGATTFDVAPYLGGLDSELASYRLGAYHHYDQRIVERPMNWKLVMDTFLEPYHLGVLHRDTVAPLFVHNLCLFEPFGLHLRELLPRTSIAAQGIRPDHELDAIKHNTVVYVLFPNTVIVIQVDHVETWRVYPVDGVPDKCVMQLDFVVSEPIESDSARRHWERNLDLTIRTVLNEDFATAMGMQRNYALGNPAQVVFGRNEPALAHFERTVNEQIAVRAAGTAGLDAASGTTG